MRSPASGKQSARLNSTHLPSRRYVIAALCLWRFFLGEDDLIAGEQWQIIFFVTTYRLAAPCICSGIVSSRQRLSRLLRTASRLTALTGSSAADPAPLPNGRAGTMHHFRSFGVRITSSDAICLRANNCRISSGRIIRAISRGVWPPRLSLGALLM